MTCSTDAFGDVSFNKLYTLGKELVASAEDYDTKACESISNLLAVDPLRMGVIKSKPAFRLSPSSLTACRRLVYFKFCQFERDKKADLSGDKWLRFKLGSMAHAMAQTLITLGSEKLGFICKTESLVSIDPIFGFLDLAIIAEGQKMVGEIKSSTAEKMCKMTAPYDSAAVQLATYIKYTGAKCGSVLMVDMGTGALKEFESHPEGTCSTWYQTAEKTRDRIIADILEKEAGKIIPKPTPGRWDCEQCEYPEKCRHYGGPHGSACPE